MRRLACLAILFPALVWAASPTAADLDGAVRQTSLDFQECYRVRDLNFNKEDIRIYLNDGYLIFSKPVGERIGAVFTGDVDGGDGEILLLPPTRGERKSLATFTQSPNLNEHFRSALFLFSDDTGRELLERISQQPTVRKAPEMGITIADQWQSAFATSITGFEMRLMTDLLSPIRLQTGFFAATFAGKTLGTFDVLYDPRASEQIIAGQRKPYQQASYNVWTSFPARSYRTGAAKRIPQPFTVEKFRIDTTLEENLHLKATTKATFKVGANPVRAFPFEVSSAEKVLSARIDGIPVELLNPTAQSSPEQLDDDEIVLAVTSDPLQSGTEHQIEFEHEGPVIGNPGNGVYSVGARSNWYPRTNTDFAIYETVFRYPSRFTLVSPGEIVSDRTEGSSHIVERRTPVPIRFVGFNLGDFQKITTSLAGLTVEVYGNRGLDPALELKPQTATITQVVPAAPRSPRREVTTTITQTPQQPDPSAQLNTLAADVAGSFQYFSELFGPPPLKTLTISPIPGTFGQGFPGLVYLSTIAYLDPKQRPAFAKTPRLQTLFSDLMAAHEVAHQWWGNVVIAENYQDEWLLEALAEYSSLLWLEKKKGPKAVEEILAGFQDDLLTVEEGKTLESAGSVTWGYRLEGSKSAEARRVIVYEKGAWILHMLRQRLGDRQFLKMLAELRRRYEFRALTTEDFRKVAQQFLSPEARADSLETFFDNWVNSTGIPTLRVHYSMEGTAAAVKLVGTLEQSGVDDSFSIDIPVEIQFAKGASQIVWVRTSDTATFSAALKQAPLRVVIPAGVLAIRK